MAFLSLAPPFDLGDPGWPVRTDTGGHPPALIRSAGGHEAHAADSMLSPGSTVAGASVTRSVLSPGVQVDPGAVVEDAILMPGVRVGAGSLVRRSIVDENVMVPPGTRIGDDLAADRRRHNVSEAGIVVVAKGTAFA